MLIKDGAVLTGLQPVMRLPMRVSEQIWIDLGREEGVTVTEGTGGTHSAGSWHYYGFAIDLRTKYKRHGLGGDLNDKKAYQLLKKALPQFDIVLHSTHIHVEIGNELAGDLGVLW